MKTWDCNTEWTTSYYRQPEALYLLPFCWSVTWLSLLSSAMGKIEKDKWTPKPSSLKFSKNSDVVLLIRICHVASKCSPVRKSVSRCKEKQGSSAGRLMSIGYVGVLLCKGVTGRQLCNVQTFLLLIFLSWWF